MHGGTDCTARAARRTEPPVRSYGDCEVSGNRSSQTIAWLGRVGRVGIGPKKDGAYGGRTRMDQVGCSILCVLFSSFLHDGSIAFNCMFVFSLNCRPQIFGQGTSTIAMEELSMAFSIAGWYAAGFLCRCSWGDILIILILTPLPLPGSQRVHKPSYLAITQPHTQWLASLVNKT